MPMLVAHNSLGRMCALFIVRKYDELILISDLSIYYSENITSNIISRTNGEVLYLSFILGPYNTGSVRRSRLYHINTILFLLSLLFS